MHCFGATGGSYLHSIRFGCALDRCIELYPSLKTRTIYKVCCDSVNVNLFKFISESKPSLIKSI